MPPMIATKRRSLSPSAKNIRILLVSSNSGFHQGTVDGLAQVDQGDFIPYRQFRELIGQRLNRGHAA